MTIKSGIANHCARADHVHGGETPVAPFWKETWFWEQLVYVIVCLGPAMVGSYLALAAKGAVGPREAVLLVGTSLAQFIAQKARGVASRQSALLKGRGIYVPEIRCAAKVKKWTQVGQVLGAFLSIATAPTWWHLPSVLWAVFVYDLWRAWREGSKRLEAAGGVL